MRRVLYQFNGATIRAVIIGSKPWKVFILLEDGRTIVLSGETKWADGLWVNVDYIEAGSEASERVYTGRPYDPDGDNEEDNE